MGPRLKKRPIIPLVNAPVAVLLDGAILREDPIREAIVKTRTAPMAGLVPQSQTMIDQ